MESCVENKKKAFYYYFLKKSAQKHFLDFC